MDINTAAEIIEQWRVENGIEGFLLEPMMELRARIDSSEASSLPKEVVEAYNSIYEGISRLF